jgi:type IV pilus assembly protein PilC
VSEHDSELPDPMELFERMNREAKDEEEPEDSNDLPDPAELFQQMEQEQMRQASEAEAEASEGSQDTFERMPGFDDVSEGSDDDFPSLWAGDDDDPFLPDPNVSWESVGEPLPFLPDPDQPGLTPEAMESDSPFFSPDPDQPAHPSPDGSLPFLPDPDQPGVSDPSLPYIPNPDEAPTAPQPVDSGETLSEGFLKKLKERFKKSQPAVSQASELEAQPESSPASLPTPEELFRRMKAEREEAALNFEAEPGAPLPAAKLPTPEELFRRMEEEYSEQTGSQLPELPDLDALKAELEAEERARLDPDVETDLAGPERFVETVSDNIFSTEQSSMFAPPTIGDESTPDPTFEPEPVPEPKKEASKKRLPIPQKPPVPPPAPPTKPKRARFVTEAEQRPEPEQQPEPEGPSPTGTVKVDPDEMADMPLKTPKRRRGRRGSASYARLEAEKAKKKTFKRFSRQKLAIFTRQMSVMLKSGIQLHMAVQFAAESDPDLHDVLNEVMRKVESGFTFSGALGETSRTFDTVYVGLIQSGEMSGRLHEILARLADSLEREVELRKRLISVITYPLVLLMVCMLGTLGFMFFVLPTLIPLFEELSVDLPLPTKILLSSREAILPVLLVSVALVVLYFFLRDRITDAIRARPMLERRLANIPFHVPVIGQVYDKLVTARVLYSLSTMLDVGITLNQALARTEVTAGNALVAFRLSKARMDLADGIGVTDCFRMNHLFSPSALYLISAGEESARLAEMFAFVARIFDEDVEYSLQTAASVLEPLIMMVMGVIVGFITIAAALPTIQLLQNFT